MLWQRFERKFSTVKKLLRAAFLIVDYAKFASILKNITLLTHVPEIYFLKK